MKKFILCFTISFVFLLGILSIQMTNMKASEVSTSACANTNYKVLANGSTLKCYTTYSEASKYMNQYQGNAYIVYNSKVIDTKYGIVKLDQKSSASVTYVYGTEYGTGYINGPSAVDAAYLGYDGVNRRYKIKLSGMVGWVNMDEAVLEPLTTSSNNTSKKYLKVTASPSLYLRNAMSKTATILDSIPENTIVEWTGKTGISDGLKWYQVTYNGKTGYVGSDQSDPYVTEVSSTTTTLETYYYVEKGFLYHRILYNSQGRATTSYNLGKAPLYLKEGVKYYSFDGLYFYTNLMTMLEDSKSNTYQNAVNELPYYNYYLYLPYRTQSNVTSTDINQIITSRGYTKKADRNYYYEFVLDNKDFVVPGIEECNVYTNAYQKRTCLNIKRIGTGRPGKWIDATPDLYSPLPGESVLVSEGANFVNSQNKYGTNALLTFSIAINESGWGRSWISIRNHNIFGHAAYDTDPDSNAAGYSSVGAGIEAHANSYVSAGYSNPKDSRYYGGFIGNKGSGMNVKYASDPYWGEKAAANYAMVVRELGVDDFKKYTIGIKQTKSSVVVRQSPSTSSKSLYQMAAVSNIPVIILETVKGEMYQGSDQWYKIQTEPSLLQNGSISNSGEYNRQYSVGYIHSSLLYVESEEPIIYASNTSIRKGTNFDAKAGVRAYDAWDGDLTSKIKTSGSVNPSIVGNYQITYTVTDSDGNQTSKTIQVNVVGDSQPVINATNKTVYLGDVLDLKAGITATDLEDGDLTNKIQVSPTTIDTSVAGKHEITYTVIDSANNEVTKTITITVSDAFKSASGSFGFESLIYNANTQKIDLKGYLTINGIQNDLSATFSYDLLLTNVDTKQEYVIPVSRWTNEKEFPFQLPNSGGKVYKYSWFNGSVDLAQIPQGDYELKMRARGRGYQTITTFRDIFFKETSQKFDKKITIGNRGYLFYRNYLDRNLPLQLFIRDQGLIANGKTPTVDNMFNSFYKIELNQANLSIRGTSHNVGGNYSKNTSVAREIVLENQTTFERTNYNIGYIDNGDYKVTLTVSDGFDKTRAWYQANLDLSQLKPGTYTILIHTKAGNIDDYGELNDIAFRSLGSTTYNGRTYTLQRNNSKRMRIELVIK